MLTCHMWNMQLNILLASCFRDSSDFHRSLAENSDVSNSLYSIVNAGTKGTNIRHSSICPLSFCTLLFPLILLNTNTNTFFGVGGNCMVEKHTFVFSKANTNSFPITEIARGNSHVKLQQNESLEEI